jgi:D-glycero-D-manno-heptose 1,7-bisphosphate phosphatase
MADLHRPRLVVLDRDGTLIRHVHYLCDPAQVELLPGVRSGLARLREAGCKLYLHTNQSGVGRGYFPLGAALRCNDEMLRQLDLGGQVFEDICVCPEAPDEVTGYRKPSPRFGLELLARNGLPAEAMCYVGDNMSDLMTAHAIGCQGIGVGTGVHDLSAELARAGLAGRFPVCASFDDVTACLLGTVGAQA